MKVEMMSRIVELPELVQLPLRPANESDPADLIVELGRPADQAKWSFPLDDAVILHIELGRVWVEPSCDLGPRALEHYLADHAVPNGLGVLGDVVLHCAGLSKGENGIVLLGSSGSGKSTTSAALARKGWGVLSDDAVRVSVDEDTVMHPTYPGVRLHEDVIDDWADVEQGSPVAEYARKTRFAIGGDPESITPSLLGSVFLLGSDTPNATLREVGAAELCARLADQLFLPPGREHDVAQRFERVSHLAASCSGYELSFRRSRAGVAEAVAAVEEAISS